MKTQFSPLELDALRELANIGSGTAGTALSALVGRPVDISVPSASAVPLTEAVEALGAPDDAVTAVVLGLRGDLEGVVVLLFAPEDEAALSALLGVETGIEMGRSALAEVGNIVGASYVTALGSMTGLRLEPEPPGVAADKRGAIVASALAPPAVTSEVALVLDSDLRIEGAQCSFEFLLIPAADGVAELLGRLGVTG